MIQRETYDSSSKVVTPCNESVKLSKSILVDTVHFTASVDTVLNVLVEDTEIWVV